MGIRTRPAAQRVFLCLPQEEITRGEHLVSVCIVDGLGLVAALGSLFVTISAALFEIVVGALAGNTVGLPLTPWIDYIASFGAIVLTFLAGTDIDPHVVKRNFASSVTIGLMGFFAPYLGCLLLGSVWPRLAVARGTDSGHRALHDIRGRRVRSNGRNGLQPN